MILALSVTKHKATSAIYNPFGQLSVLQIIEDVEECCVNVFLEANLSPVVLARSQLGIFSHYLTGKLTLNIDVVVHANHQLTITTFLIGEIVSFVCQSDVINRLKFYHALVMVTELKVCDNMSVSMDDRLLVRSDTARTTAVLHKGNT